MAMLSTGQLRFAHGLLWTALLALGMQCDPLFAQAPEESKSDIKEGLVVLIAVDQLRRDRLAEVAGGALSQLLAEGRVFDRAVLGHGVSTTCPGHAVMLTGLHPNRHGLPSNTFFDREAGKVRYCLEDDDPETLVLGGTDRRSPRNMTATTFGDWLKRERPSSKVFSVAAKDRAAIAMGGQQPDGVYWFDRSQGRFTTSGYYSKTLPSYVKAFNGSEPTEDGFMASLPMEWTHPTGRLRPDDYEGEDPRLNRISGHPVISADAATSAASLYPSPYMDSVTVDLAMRVLEAERLGSRDALDVLAVGLSATDTIGHLYGPRSAEAEDGLRRLDADLNRLLEALMSSVPRNKLWIVLTADHGVAELPEWRHEQRSLKCPEPSGRISYLDLGGAIFWGIYKHFSWPFGDPRDWVSLDGGHLVVNREKARAAGVDPSDVIGALEAALESLDYVVEAWRADELLDAKSEAGRLMAKSYVPGRTGDLLLQLAEDCLIDELGTTHGSLYAYDRDVPLVIAGPGVMSGVDSQPAETVDIGPTLADLLGVTPPPALDGEILRLHGDR